MWDTGQLEARKPTNMTYFPIKDKNGFRCSRVDGK